MMNNQNTIEIKNSVAYKSTSNKIFSKPNITNDINIKHFNTIEQYPESSQQPTQLVSGTKSFFDLDQMACICEVLKNEKKFNKLEEFLKLINIHYFLKKIKIKKILEFKEETILISYVHLLYHQKKHPDLLRILSLAPFSKSNHRELQQIWYQTHYDQASIKLGREMQATDKFRIRRKNPHPSTIWDGEDTLYFMKVGVRAKLNESFQNNPYPNNQQKEQLSSVTGLSISQIINWFKNKRQRVKHQKSSFPLNNKHFYFTFTNSQQLNKQKVNFLDNKFEDFKVNENDLMSNQEKKILKEENLNNIKTPDNFDYDITNKNNVFIPKENTYLVQEKKKLKLENQYINNNYLNQFNYYNTYQPINYDEKILNNIHMEQFYQTQTSSFYYTTENSFQPSEEFNPNNFIQI